MPPGAEGSCGSCPGRSVSPVVREEVGDVGKAVFSRPDAEMSCRARPGHSGRHQHSNCKRLEHVTRNTCGNYGVRYCDEDGVL